MSGTHTAFDEVEFLPKVLCRITEFFDERVLAARPLGAQYEQLWESARTASDGGKRWRPGFVLETYHGLGGRDHTAVLELATAFELLHTAFLLHDDVIDRDLIRRGIPNLAGRFRDTALTAGIEPGRAGHWGQSAAILAGDLLIHYAQSLVSRLDVPAEIRLELLDVLDRSIFVTAAGELSDVALSMGIVDAPLPEVLAMTEHKTAAYSFEGPLVAGAILAGASEEVRSSLAEYGRLVGTAFQLGDDLLGLFGSERGTGKSAINDLREGKETLLIAYARSTPEWARIAPVFGKPDVSETEAGCARRVIADCGARSFVEGMIADFVDRAVAALASSPLPGPLRERFTEGARRCLGRAA